MTCRRCCGEPAPCDCVCEGCEALIESCAGTKDACTGPGLWCAVHCHCGTPLAEIHALIVKREEWLKRTRVIP